MREYAGVWQEMKDFTNARSTESSDELWVVEHPAVYTLGQAGKLEHILNPGQIEVVPSDRGGQVTYHGPGQVVVYTLLDLRRAGFGIRELVVRLENAVIDTLEKCGISAMGRRDAPGVYVGEKKIAALGLRVRRGCAYHGLSLNIDIDLKPFQGINPCGYAGLEVTSMQKLGSTHAKQVVVEYLLQSLVHQLDTADTLS